MKSRIGKGHYGVIYSAKDKLNNKTIAIKMVDSTNRDELNHYIVPEEVKVLYKLRENDPDNTKYKLIQIAIVVILLLNI